MLHLKKLCVGCDDIAHLRRWQSELYQQLKSEGKEKFILPFHDTRNMPRRRDEMQSASLYWIKKKKFFARQKIHFLEERYDEAGKKFCRIWLERPVIAVAPHRDRIFQGWRYLKEADTPPDIENGHNDIEAELRQMGLLV